MLKLYLPASVYFKPELLCEELETKIEGHKEDSILPGAVSDGCVRHGASVWVQ